MKKLDTYTINEAVEALTLVRESDYRKLEKSYEALLSGLREISKEAKNPALAHLALTVIAEMVSMIIAQAEAQS